MIGMGGQNCSDCREAVRLRTALREAQDELAEWKRAGIAYGATSQHVDRLAQLRAKLSITNRPGRLLLDLLQHVGQVRTKDQLYAARAVDDFVELKIVDVEICKLRKALNRGAAAVRIDTIWGQGYRMPAASAEALRQLMGWGAP